MERPSPESPEEGFCKDELDQTMTTAPHTGTSALVRTGVDSYAQVLAASGGVQTGSLMRNGDGSDVCASIYTSPPYDLQVPPLPVSRLSVNLTRSRVFGGVQGDVHCGYETLRHAVFFVPAGVAMAWRKDSPSRHMTIYFRADAFDCTEVGAAAFDPQQPLFNVQIAGLHQLSDPLAAELDRPGMLSSEATDSLARLLIIRIARHLRVAREPSNPLNSKVLQRVRDYIAANLSERLLVADLARVAGMSPNRFAHAFGRQTGQSPHQCVFAARLDRASHLLRTSDLPLVEVAHDCGFSNQQHLSNAMRRHLGTTPTRYRSMYRKIG